MIEHIQGRLVEKNPGFAVIDCSGVGYHILISLNTYGQIGNEELCKLYTHLAVREDAHTLYGFAHKDEREMFRHLISVSGVGANTARMILSAMTPTDIRNAILENNVDRLKSIKGIGAKSAQRLIVDLGDKLRKLGDFEDISTPASNTNKQEALSALVALGFDKRTAEKTLDKVLAESGEQIELEGLIKQALKYL